GRIGAARRADEDVPLNLLQRPEGLRRLAELYIPRLLRAQPFLEIRWSIPVRWKLLRGRRVRDQRPHLQVREHRELNEDIGGFFQVERGVGVLDVGLGDGPKREAAQVDLSAMCEADQKIQGTAEDIRLYVISHDAFLRSLHRLRGAINGPFAAA